MCSHSGLTHCWHFLFPLLLLQSKIIFNCCFFKLDSTSLKKPSDNHKVHKAIKLCSIVETRADKAAKHSPKRLLIVFTCTEAGENALKLFKSSPNANKMD